VIAFNNIEETEPYLLFKEHYSEAKKKGQKNIEAISIASYQRDSQEVDSRFVNLKYVEKNKWVFLYKL